MCFVLMGMAASFISAALETCFDEDMNLHKDWFKRLMRSISDV